MGYRGSKSGILSIPIPKRIFVKEQRVDGSWFLNINKNLRYTLIETNSVFYLTIYLTKLEQQNI